MKKGREYLVICVFPLSLKKMAFSCFNLSNVLPIFFLFFCIEFKKNLLWMTLVVLHRWFNSTTLGEGKNFIWQFSFLTFIIAMTLLAGTFINHRKPNIVSNVLWFDIISYLNIIITVQWIGSLVQKLELLLLPLFNKFKNWNVSLSSLSLIFDTHLNVTRSVVLAKFGKRWWA